MINEEQRTRGQEGKQETSLNKTLSRICKFAFCSLTNSTPVLKLLHAHRVLPKLLRNRRLNPFAIRINSLSLNHPSAIPLSQRERVMSKAAFTLAEVLITLGIIGVVAAMTMPALITKHQKQVTVTSLKKIYTTMSQAKQLSETQNGAMEYWDFPPTFDKSDIEQFFDKYFRPYMQVIGECESEKSCSSIYTAERPIYILKDGTQIIFSPNAQSDTLNSAKKYIHTCIDTNGNKGPNRYGKDMFVINIYPQKGAVLFGQASDFDPIPKGREELKTGISINSGTETSCCSHSCPVQYAKYYNCGALIQADGWQIKDDYPW